MLTTLKGAITALIAPVAALCSKIMPKGEQMFGIHIGTPPKLSDFNFKSKLAKTGDHSTPDVPAVKIGQMSFTQNADGVCDFTVWKAQVAGQPQVLTVDGNLVPTDSTLGKAMIFKTQLQLEEGFSPEQAQQTAYQAYGINPTNPMSIESMKSQSLVDQIPAAPASDLHPVAPADTTGWHDTNSMPTAKVTDSHTTAKTPPKEFRSSHGRIPHRAPPGGIR
jgi:hypothetical protein